jgi:hypothetical protein
MKLELGILAVTAFLIANAYYDGKYITILKSWKKYYQMALYGFIGLSLYLMLKRNPKDSHALVKHATGMLKTMPIDREAGDFISPLLGRAFGGGGGHDNTAVREQRLLSSGLPTDAKPKTKRSVSETKKKYVAAQQNWHCGKCQKQLPAWFEVDHVTRLDQGGSNHVDNLVALCRNCHGEKTAMENL